MLSMSTERVIDTAVRALAAIEPDNHRPALIIQMMVGGDQVDKMAADIMDLSNEFVKNGGSLSSQSSFPDIEVSLRSFGMTCVDDAFFKELNAIGPEDPSGKRVLCGEIMFRILMIRAAVEAVAMAASSMDGKYLDRLRDDVNRAIAMGQINRLIRDFDKMLGKDSDDDSGDVE